MKAESYYIMVLITVFGFSFKASAQVPNVDSLQKAILESVQKGLKNGNVSDSYFDTSKLFKGQSPVDLDRLFKEIGKEVRIAESKGDIDKAEDGYRHLSKLDSMRGNYKGAYENYKLYALYRDSLQKKETEKRELQQEFEKKQAIAKAEQEKKDSEAKRVKNLQYFAIAGLLVLLLVIILIALIQWKNNRQRKKTNTLLQSEKEKVESALLELKTTQNQLIQSEKMASLGELTAGIAHEIQNPLNFVNNFSEVNKEMIEELEHERSKVKGERNEEAENEILQNIKANEEKINHHGRRADAIVKGMLQHSRTSSGQKELTDINALTDEYLRLAYHGLRAKDKSFNAKFITEFDKNAGKVNIVPQEIGRVILNLINNAFYAVNEKKRLSSDGYEPTVTITTRSIQPPSGGRSVEIRVIDNGGGIPQKNLDKIFQPFFTTKATGHGTGLGLSLAYDIVTKGHNGEIRIESKEGEGSEFIVIIPSTQ